MFVYFYVVPNASSGVARLILRACFGPWTVERAMLAIAVSSSTGLLDEMPLGSVGAPALVIAEMFSNILDIQLFQSRWHKHAQTHRCH